MSEVIGKCNFCGRALTPTCCNKGESTKMSQLMSKGKLELLKEQLPNKKLDRVSCAEDTWVDWLQLCVAHISAQEEQVEGLKESLKDLQDRSQKMYEKVNKERSKTQSKLDKLVGGMERLGSCELFVKAAWDSYSLKGDVLETELSARIDFARTTLNDIREEG